MVWTGPDRLVGILRVVPLREGRPGGRWEGPGGVAAVPAGPAVEGGQR